MLCCVLGKRPSDETVWVDYIKKACTSVWGFNVIYMQLHLTRQYAIIHVFKRKTDSEQNLDTIPPI